MNKEQEKGLAHAKAAVIGAAFGICSLDELALFRRLEALYCEGYNNGHESMNPIIKDITNKLSKVILAHMEGNSDEVERLLDDIVKQNVIVVHAESKTTH